MYKYEVEVTFWVDESKKFITSVEGTFDKYLNAKLFADAYSAHYRTAVNIVEYKKNTTTRVDDPVDTTIT